MERAVKRCAERSAGVAALLLAAWTSGCALSNAASDPPDAGTPDETGFLNNSAADAGNNGATNNATPDAGNNVANNGGAGLGSPCSQDAQCQSGVCGTTSGRCLPGSCGDGVRQPEEQSTDCGGPSCDPCTCEGGDEGDIVERGAWGACGSTGPCGESVQTATWTACEGGRRVDYPVSRECGRGDLPEFACAPAGFYTRGSPTAEAGHNAGETQHRVTFTYDTLIQTTEVTQAQWTQHYPLPPGNTPGCPDCPVVFVNWFEALAYANIRSRNEGLTECYNLFNCSGSIGSGCGSGDACRGDFNCTAQLSWPCEGYRLPTDAEWEYAARAGQTGTTYAPLPTAAWYSGNAAGALHPVAEKLPNAWRLYDTLGNVAEWGYDFYGAFGSASLQDQQAIDFNSEYPVVRGGAFNDTSADLRFARRLGLFPLQRQGNLGFRLARTR